MIIFSPVKSEQSIVTETMGPGAQWPRFVFGLLFTMIMVSDNLIYLSELLFPFL